MFTFQYQWRSDIEIEADIDLVDSAQLELPKNSLQGGKTYVITSNVVIEAQDKSLVKAEASIPLTVELKGEALMVMKFSGSATKTSIQKKGRELLIFISYIEFLRGSN